LKSINPTLSEEWNYAKNINLTTEMVSPHSNKKVWWDCKKCRQEWQATVNDRSQSYGCPYCSGRKVIKGENDLLALYPYIAEEWSYRKNYSIKPNDIGTKSSKKVWWVCKKCGQEWQATLNSRVNGRGCPYCSGRNPIEGINDLNTINHQLAVEWNYEKNKDLIPEKVSAYSNKKVWWKCKAGHEWQATVNHRSRGSKCTICNGGI
jgi:DNA-directed RNA polymerase subunit RPC12/RpoP